MSLSKGVILSGVERRRLLTDSNLEKSAVRGCRRGKWKTIISQAKGQIFLIRNPYFMDFPLLHCLLILTAIHRISGVFCFVRFAEYFFRRFI